MKRAIIFVAGLIFLSGAAIPAKAQVPIPPPAPDVVIHSSAELDQMLGPVALYPDPLTAEILPAATLPSQIVIADRYVSGGGDPNLIDQQPWDASVKGLARYPSVLKMMDDNIAWTTDLGQAFLNQPQDVMDSIQRLRNQALTLGNLQNTPQETIVSDDDGTVEILPADPNVVYVPVYQPDVVYYQHPYGAPVISFGIGFALGAWLNHDFDWHHHDLIVWRHDDPRPRDWWTRRPAERETANIKINVWHPRGGPVVSVPNRVDRGWAPEAHPVAVVRPEARPPERREEPVKIEHVVAPPHPTVSVTRIGGGQPPRPVEAPRPGNVSVTRIGGGQPARPANAALIGVQSARDTRQASSRGQESRQVVSRPAPVVHSAPAAPPHPSAPVHSAPPSPPSRR